MERQAGERKLHAETRGSVRPDPQSMKVSIPLRCGICAFQKDRCKSCQNSSLTIVNQKPMKTNPENDPTNFPPDPNTWKEILAIGILIFLACAGVGSCTGLCKTEITINLPVKTTTK